MNQETFHPPQALISYLVSLKTSHNTGALATLRCALSNSNTIRSRAWPQLARFGGIPRFPFDLQAETVRVIAGLITLPGLNHVENDKNFGCACLSLLSQEERQDFLKTNQLGPIARRFQYLLAATPEEISSRVITMARRLAQKEVALDFTRLFKDLRWWDNNVREKWALSFWNADFEEENEPSTNLEDAA